MMTTTTAQHTCFGKVFCGFPREIAKADCRVCTPRYVFAGGDHEFPLCIDCSTRVTAVRVPADELDEHDAWHAANAALTADDLELLGRDPGLRF